MPAAPVARPSERHARLRALGRRGSESKPPILRVADLTLDTVTREARRSGAAIELTMANTAEVAIANTGSGIPAEILPRVFDPFFRGDPSHSHSHAVDGCGLGLSIARWIATAHGGNIQSKSHPSRAGSRQLPCGCQFELPSTYPKATERAVENDPWLKRHVVPSSLGGQFPKRRPAPFRWTHQPDPTPRTAAAIRLVPAPDCCG